MKVTIKTDDGKSYTGTMIEETKSEPRIGTLCMFWDEWDDKKGPYVLEDIRITPSALLIFSERYVQYFERCK